MEIITKYSINPPLHRWILCIDYVPTCSVLICLSETWLYYLQDFFFLFLPFLLQMDTLSQIRNALLGKIFQILWENNLRCITGDMSPNDKGLSSRNKEDNETRTLCSAYLIIIATWNMNSIIHVPKVKPGNSFKKSNCFQSS